MNLHATVSTNGNFGLDQNCLHSEKLHVAEASSTRRAARGPSRPRQAQRASTPPRWDSQGRRTPHQANIRLLCN